MNLKNLELFVRTAATGAIGRAGQDLGLSAANASQRLQTLEESLAVKLLNRTTRAVSLTPDGEVFLDHAKRILDAVVEAESAMSGTQTRLHGTLRVTASASFARTHITPFIPEFVSMHPDLNIELHLSDSVVDIVEQGFDVAFRIGELAPSTLLARKLDNNPELLVAAPKYIETHGMPETPQQLKDHVCIALGRSPTWKLMDAEDQIHTISTTSPLTVNLGDAVGEWVLAGLGIGHASLWHVGQDLEDGRLVQVLPDYHVVPEKKLWAVRPPGRIMPRRVQVFLDFMQGKICETNTQRFGSIAQKLFPQIQG